MTSSPRARSAILVAVAVLLAGLVFFLSLPRTPDALPASSTTPALSATPTAPASPTASTSPTSAAPSPSVSEAATCTTAEAGFVPTRYTIASMGVDEPVVALGEDETGAIAAPPKDEPRMASWWENGPKPGDAQGRAVLSIHTYRNGGALGNELFRDDGTTPLQPGDVIALHDEAGNTACYAFSHFTEIVADDYDPDSDVMLDFDGPPSLVIIICSGFEPETKIWRNRVLFYATRI
ncbi:MAG TPA: class F sortase [Arachnia sp.]|nr:class F sortase [Arachnia sp.]HMT87396.1 class F sortase [Arachnia sp.]